MTKPLDPRRAGLLGLLALLHLGLAWLMLHQLRTQAAGAAPARTSISVSLLLDSPKPPKPSKPSPSPNPLPPKPAATLRPPPPVQTRPEPAPQATAVSSLATSLPATSAPATATAAQPPVTGSILDSEATRRALRMAAKTPLLSERAAGAMGEEPLSAEQKLAQEMKKAGTGDCLKGEFLGAGSGLLSIPFWLLAEARGKCSK
ncbi:hypothetical protein HNP55_000673 [Paucibacter oligotrophus]|uniref:Uncharacterized protein n=1 Tax=Roseateles oligotrophus TaxID=1769250 RepID=A0A840L7I4_9BURK|nr:hypothetical protein [Roseateles oligotrophus]MBB4842178.1 hypothetical protein [Roseateles oligotrophus]